MESIVPILGNVRFSITLDPSVWIFDDRKKKMDDFFNDTNEAPEDLEAYTKAVSAHWDKEMTEGAQLPPTKKPKRKYNKQELKTESYGIYFRDFLQNSEPGENAEKVIVETENGEHHPFPLQEANQLILCFSHKGKALKEDGPVHVYYGSTMDEKITHVRAFRVE
ncbi:peptidyl-prolyl cis-trans isomerase [Bacillus sp. 1P06AnD]|uniref:peptidyl-prolyl cis-trans isomerase n=1 Tax=Bacillus sp. 1P06AnD TaxID=3132208 RepID=UPI0039A1D849